MNSKEETHCTENDCQNRSIEKKKEEKKNVPIFSLYKYSDNKDRMLQIIGLLFASCCGLIYPLLAIVFGEMMNNIGINESNDYEKDSEDSKKDIIIKNSLYLLYLSLFSGISGLIWIFCLKLTAERQINKIRCLYFGGMVRQDICWYDKRDVNSLSSGVIEDSLLMLNGMGVDVGKLALYSIQFVAAFIIGMLKDWSMTLVIMALGIPLMLLGSNVGMIIEKYVIKVYYISSFICCYYYYGIVSNSICRIKWYCRRSNKFNKNCFILWNRREFH